MMHAWDDFRDRVLNMASHDQFLTISTDLARRMLAEHEKDCDQMERAAETIEGQTLAIEQANKRIERFRNRIAAVEAAIYDESSPSKSKGAL